MAKEPAFDDLSWFEKILEKPIAFHRVYARLTGDVRAAVFLAQAYYWSDKGDDPDGWFYKKQTDWEKETCLTRRHQEKAREILYSLGFWEEKLKDVPAKLYYRLDRPKFYKALWTFLNVQNSQTVDSKDLPQFVHNSHSEMAKPAKQVRRKRPLHVTENTTQRILTETTREESLKPSLTAVAVGPVSPLLFPVASPSNNPNTDKHPPSVHADTQLDSFAADGGESSGGISPQVALDFGGAGSGPTLAVKNEPRAVSASVRGGRKSSDTVPKTQKTPKPPPDPRASHPAIAALRDLVRRFPKEILWDKIIERLGDTPNIEKLRECYLAHVERGFNLNSWIWATEWYQAGIPQNNLKQRKERKYETGTDVNELWTDIEQREGVKFSRRPAGQSASG